MAIIQGNAKQGSTRGFYPKIINGSLRFNDDDSAYLVRDQLNGNTTTWTFSTWIKRSGSFDVQHPIMSVGANNTNDMLLYFMQPAFSDILDFTIRDSSTIRGQLRTAMKFRDPSAWYHIVAVCDTTNATQGDRLRLYVNGERVTSFYSTPTYPSQNQITVVNNSSYDMYISKLRADTSTYLDGLMAETYFIDGQALTADDFGELKNGVWVAKDYAGTFGTNGFYLTFEDDTQVEAFNTVLYRGNGSGNQSITGMGMNADLYWIKRRDAAGGWNCVDTVRGPHKRLELHSTGADYNQTLLQSFDSDGFTTGVTGVGESGGSYVAFGWDAGANNAVTGHSSVTYTGNGTDNHRISGLPFTPDLIWGKKRSAAGSHFLLDSVRGVNSTLSSDTTSAEDTTADIFRGFDKDGFILGSNGQSNSSGVTYVAWAWDAGDSDPVTNTDGSITSTVKASTTNGFSIVSYTGTLANATVGHGLSSAPTFMIIRDRDNANDWAVWHTDIGTDQLLKLNSTGAPLTNTSFWNDTAPTSSVIHLGTTNLTNNNGNNICYAWHDVTGKQKFGSYTGTGSDVTVNVGFRPGFLLVKWTGGGGATAENWAIVDASRDPINNLTKGLFPNTSGAEQDSALNNEVEFTSTGFVVKNTDARWNANGGTYIYAAFAGSYSDYITDYNTDGSIDSRVKASDTTGFSIATFTGASDNDSIGHGLGVAPDMVIFKKRSAVGDWWVYHSSLGANSAIRLNDTGAAYTGYNYWPTVDSTKIQFDGTSAVTGGDVVAYCWTETTGYSKFGSYTGNGSTTGPTITTGFKPAFVLVKASSVAGERWCMHDNTRTVANGNSNVLFADASLAENTALTYDIDFLDTGFQIKTSHESHNQSGQTYIYAAFADTREAAFWLDQSGNDNDWQPVNLDHNDTVADSPTNNFATLNPLDSNGATLSDGNLVMATPASGGGNTRATMAVSSGQWYWEATLTSGSQGQIGIQSSADAIGSYLENGTVSTYGYAHDGYKFINGSFTAGYGASYTTGDTIGVALDLDSGTLTMYKNGVSQGVLSSSVASGYTYHPAFSDSSGTGQVTWSVNFGQQPFKYDPPA